MPGRLHTKGRRSTRSRPYERRRRTRRAPRNQRGGENEGQTLTTWLAAAKQLHEKLGPAPQDFASLRNPALSLTQGAGPILEGYTPPFLGDIMANVAISLGEILPGQRIDSGATFTAAMKHLDQYENSIYKLIVGLEGFLRKIFQGQVLAQSIGISAQVSLSTPPPVDGPTPFVWIAFANLPEGQLEPRAPVLGNPEDLNEQPQPPA
jgi:hypothetical protein